MSPRRATALASLPLLALALVGCGDESDDDAADDLTSTPADGSDVDVAEFRTQVRAGAEKVETVHVESTNEGTTFHGSSTGDFDYTQDPTSYHVTADLGGSPVEIIAIGSDSWTKMGEKWVQSERDDVDDASDPYAQVDEALDEAESVTFVGEQDHAGSRAGVYEVVLRLDADDSDELTDPDLPESVTLQLWLDSEDRVVKMTGSFVIGGEKDSSETVLSAFDEPVMIEAPAAADVR